MCLHNVSEVGHAKLASTYETPDSSLLAISLTINRDNIYQLSENSFQCMERRLK